MARTPISALDMSVGSLENELFGLDGLAILYFRESVTAFVYVRDLVGRVGIII